MKSDPDVSRGGSNAKSDSIRTCQHKRINYIHWTIAIFPPKSEKVCFGLFWGLFVCFFKLVHYIHICQGSFNFTLLRLSHLLNSLQLYKLLLWLKAYKKHEMKPQTTPVFSTLRSPGIGGVLKPQCSERNIQDHVCLAALRFLLSEFHCWGPCLPNTGIHTVCLKQTLWIVHTYVCLFSSDMVQLASFEYYHAKPNLNNYPFQILHVHTAYIEEL